MLCLFRTLLVAGLLISLGGTSLAADNELTAEEREAGWRLLFNGSDHTGWMNNNGKPIATPVEDGSLLPYKAGGYVVMHKEQFGDFVLRCDVKQSVENCNSGVFFRVGDPKNPVNTGFEVQVFRGGTDYHAFGAIYDLVAPSKNVVKPVGEWNQLEITCRGPLIRVVLNGQQVAETNVERYTEPGQRLDGTKHKFGVAIKDMPRSGYLGFQDHGQKCWYKNVKLLDLSKK